jgi:NTP pyrophosphatase (non-canonical NTP hydrolase)
VSDIIPGCEDFCDECRSRYTVPELDGADGSYSFSYECTDEEDCESLAAARLEALHEKFADMKADDYQRACLRTAGVTGHDALPMVGLGIAGEAGEVADDIKKAVYHQHGIDPERLAKELGDALWYIAVAGDCIGYPLSTIMAMNIEKLQKRYPDGFTVDASINRED